MGSALLGLGGRAVERGGVEARRLGVGERLGALAADGLDAGRAVDHVLWAGAEEGVELGRAHALLVCVGGQEREQQVRVVGVGGGLVGGPTLLFGGLGGAFERRFALWRAMSASAAAALASVTAERAASSWASRVRAWAAASASAVWAAATCSALGVGPRSAAADWASPAVRASAQSAPKSARRTTTARVRPADMGRG